MNSKVIFNACEPNIVPNIPRISIGMPVHNGEASIRKALDSLMNQSFTDFELIISDNASSDQTESICREYAQNDKRVKYIRQNSNLGAVANFEFVLDIAVGDYFMWAAADDSWVPDYCSNLISEYDVLEKENRGSDSVVVCYGTAYMQDKKAEWESVPPNYSHRRSINRVLRYALNYDEGSIFYGLYRRELIVGRPLPNCYGGDYLYMFELFAKYKGKRVEGAIIKRSAHGGSSLESNKTVKEFIMCLGLISKFYSVGEREAKIRALYLLGGFVAMAKRIPVTAYVEIKYKLLNFWGRS